MDSIVKKILQDKVELMDDKILLSPPSSAEYKRESEKEIEPLLAALMQYTEDIKNGKRKEDPTLSVQAKKISSALGMTESGAEERIQLAAQKETLTKAVVDLEKELTRADQLLLSHPYTL